MAHDLINILHNDDIEQGSSDISSVWVISMISSRLLVTP